jgi:DNA-binding transcriptional regulator YhcF (GntR family)
MSAYVSGLCYEVKFGCPTTKSVAVALADHASQDGSKAFPSVKLLADKCEVSPRTIQRALRKLEMMGVLVIVRGGGRGPRDTREWKFDLHLLRTAAATDTKEIIPEDKGDNMTSLYDGLRVTPVTPKGDTDDTKGDTGVTRTVTNLQEPRIAPLPPTEDEASGSGQVDFIDGKGTRYRPAIYVRAGDKTFERWIQHVSAKFGPTAASEIASAAEIRVPARWPSGDSPMPEVVRGL